jgi:putative hydrolase of the HAD superfamily
MNNHQQKYQCIFFDLDHTLWDYETNSRDTLFDLYGQYALEKRGVAFDAFHQQFRSVNNQLWNLYDRGLVDSDTIRKERFKQILEAFEAFEETLCAELSEAYLVTCPLKGTLMPYALETLDYLAGKYSLTVVTNGFDEIQQTKLKTGKLLHYFDHIVTSQTAGHKKPSREIFNFALQSNSIRPQEAIMVGDNLITDIGGAKNAAIDAVYFNPEQNGHQEIVHYEISSLAELRQFL